MIFVLLWLSVAAWAQGPRPGQSFTFPDSGAKVVDMAICSSGDSIVFAAVKAGAPQQRTYGIFTIAGGAVKEITTRGTGSIAASPEGHLFAITVPSGSGSELILVDDQGTLAGLHRHDQRLWDPQFSSDGRELLLRSHVPGAGRAESDPAFTAFAVYGIYDQQFRTVMVSPPGLALRRAPGAVNVYVFPIADAKAGGVRVYDGNGTVASTRPAVRGVALSATGLYYFSPQPDTGGAFTVHDAATHRQIREYNRAGKPEGLIPLRWHPKNDKWLAVWRDGGDGSRALEVLDADSGRTVRNIYRFEASGGNVAWAWSPDGSSMVIFHSGKFWFEPIKP